MQLDLLCNLICEAPGLATRLTDDAHSMLPVWGRLLLFAAGQAWENARLVRSAQREKGPNHLTGIILAHGRFGFITNKVGSEPKLHKMGRPKGQAWCLPGSEALALFSCIVVRGRCGQLQQFGVGASDELLRLGSSGLRLIGRTLRYPRERCAGNPVDYFCRAFNASNFCFNCSSFWPASASLPSAVRR